MPEREYVRVFPDPQRRTIAVVGELDFTGGPMLLDVAARMLATPGPLTIDLAELTFVDAGGLGALAVLAGWQRAAGQRFGVVHASARIRRTVEIGGLAVLLADDG